MSREEMTDEELESQLRDHFNEEYGETRRSAELWRALQPRLDRHNTLDALPLPQRLNGSGASRPVKPGGRRPNVDEDWLPLPRGVKPTRARRRSFVVPAALVACLVLAVALGAYLLSRARDVQPDPTRVVSVPTEAVALGTPTVASPVEGTLILQMTPADWLLRGDRSYLYETRPDTRETYSGTASAYLQPISPDESGDAYLVKMVNRPELAGKRVRFSAYIKAAGVQDHAELWLATSDYLPRFGRIDGNLNREIKGTTGWERYEITQDVPAGSISISFGVRLVGKGKIWIDAAKLEVVGQDVPVLATRSFVNGDFEGGISGWDVSGAAESVRLDTSAFHGGTSSVRLVGSKSLTAKALPRIKQTVQLSGYAGKRIRVSAFVKTENVSKWGTIYAELEEKVSGSASSRLAYDDLYTRPISSTSDWTQYSIVMDVPQGNEANMVLTVGAFLDGGGTMLVDDIAVEEVAMEVALTGAQLLDQPNNFDFETGLNTWLVDGTFPSGYEIGLDDQDVHGGKASAYIKANPSIAGDTDSAGLEQWFDTSQFRGQRIRLSGYIRSNNVSRNVIFRLLAQSADLRSGNVAQLPVGTIYGRTGWQKYDLVVDVPKESLYISVLMSLEGQGEVWLDDLSIDIVDRSVPLTGSTSGLPTAPLGSLQFRYEMAMKNGGCT
jgi:hypothetical protein